MENAPSVDPVRLAAWEALSELFLDTELTGHGVSSIVRQLRSTGFSVQELERIYEEEVAPVCWRNLQVPAGVWTGFDPAWLAQAIQSRQRSASVLDRLSWWKRWRIKRWTSLSRVEWERVRRLLTA